ncbi:glycoside hydrolase family 26 protein [Streptacidiphilus cavernicola]|uniref:Glycoside hydrolase family 26 protein n=1 Tax=Streptacidiphilus cavernicola TaxID=3342716 RepID=A0ABV6W4P6_9ACTN
MALLERSRRWAVGVSAAVLAALALAVPALAVPALAVPAPAAGVSAAPASGRSVPAPTLLDPAAKYLGLAQDRVPQDAGLLAAAATRLGKAPNLLEYYASFNEEFNAAATRNAWNSGALTLLTWEPYTVSVADIAAGKDDAYLRRFAGQVRAADLPVALNFGHEMNGGWYPWGSAKSKPADFVAAYRHIHQVFQQAGAKKVIWVWTANIVNHVPGVPLEPLYPGDSYVDWIGMSGYNEAWEHWTSADVFGKTVQEVRGFSRKPLLIAETGVDAGPTQATRISELFDYVAKSRDVIGLVYFDYDQRMDWRFETAADSLAAVQRGAAAPQFGFDVRTTALRPAAKHLTR